MLSRLSIIQKMAISTVAFLSCIVALIYFYSGSIDANIDFARQEVRGNAYQRALMPLLYNVSKLQQAHQQAADSSATIASINNDLKALQSVHTQLGAALQFTDEGLTSRGRQQLKLETVMAKWNELQKVTATAYSPDADAAYKSLLADVRGMIAHAGDTSNLILDPDLDSYYLMDITLLVLPQTIDRLGQINASLMGKTALDEEQKVEAAVQARMVKEGDFDRISADFDTAFKEDKNFNGESPTFKANLAKPIEEFNAAYTSLNDQLNTLAKSGSKEDIAKASALALAAQEAAAKMWDVAVIELDVLLQKRIDNYSMQKYEVLAKCGAGLLLAILFFMFVVRDITRPLKDIKSTMGILTSGNIRHTIPHTSRGDEAGEMASSLEIFQKGLIEREDMKIQQEEEKQWAEHERKSVLKRMADSFESSVKSVMAQVESSVGKLQDSAIKVNDIAADTKQRSTVVVNISSDAAAVSTQVAAAAEELTASIREISTQTQNSSRVAQEAASKANDAKKSIEVLEEKSGRVHEIISTITSIAGQINLLALNATIESARAGEAGKGFAVVASEVKALATQVAKATDEITKQIDEMQSATQSSVGAVMQILGIIDNVSASTATVAAAVEEQTAVTNEIAHNVVRTSNGTKDISQNMNTVQKSADETGIAANEVLESTELLGNQSTMLKQKVDEFLATVRAA